MNYCANQDYILRNIGGEHVLITVGSAVRDFCGVITLNETAAFLWNLLQRGTTDQEMLKELTGRYDISKEQAAKDIQETIAMLQSRSMVNEVVR